MGLHVYGVMRSSATLPADAVGRQDARPRLVVRGSLAAIVSDVDPAARAGRADLLAHAHLLEACADEQTVIPVRFGVVVPDDDAVGSQLLDSRRAHLEELLETFDGMQQVTVQAFLEEATALREVLRRRPDLARLRGQSATANGVWSEQDVELGRGIAETLEELTTEQRDTLLDALGPIAAMVAEETPGGAYEIMHAAFLVQREQRSSFDEMIGQLREGAAGSVRIRYVGPQPPYAFLDDVGTAEPAWA